LLLIDKFRCQVSTRPTLINVYLAISEHCRSFGKLEEHGAKEQELRIRDTKKEAEELGENGRTG